MLFKKIGLFFIILLLFNVSYAEELVSKEAVNYYNEGVEAQKAGDFSVAMASYQKALLLGPKDNKLRKVIINNIGAMYVKQGNLEKAKVVFNYALAVDPYYKSALFNLGLVFYIQKDMVKALGYWAQLLNVGDPPSGSVVVEDAQETEK